MSKSGSVFERAKNLNPEQLQVLLTLLTDATSAVIEPPPEIVKEDLYMALHPDVRRLLVELGQEENKEVRMYLLQLNKERIELQTEMLHDYKNAKSLWRMFKIAWGSIIAAIIAVYGFVKASPEVLEWLRSFLVR